MYRVCWFHVYITIYLSIYVDFDAPSKSQLRMCYDSMTNCMQTALFYFSFKHTLEAPTQSLATCQKKPTLTNVNIYFFFPCHH